MNSSSISPKYDRPRVLILSISLISASALSYEILLMRLFSIIQWHHFAYMIISVALLGFGTSGTFLSLFRSWAEKHFSSVYMLNGLFLSISMVACFSAAQHIPFNGLEAFWNPFQSINLLAIYLLLVIPFFCAANCIGLSFMVFNQKIPYLYRGDLVGAGLGGALVLLGLFYFFPQTLLKILGILSLFGSVLVAFDPAIPSPRRGWAVGGLPILLILTFWPEQWISLKISEYKGLPQALEVVGAEVLTETSSPLGLLTVVRNPTVPFRYAPGYSLQGLKEPPLQLGVFTDGDGLNVITKFTGSKKKLAYMDSLLHSLPFRLLQNPKVLILGAGGGTDVLLAHYNDSPRIDAVEINAQIIRLVRDRFSEFAGGLYTLEPVRVFESEARGFLAGNRARYDLIQLSLLESFSASAAGVHAVTEGYLYTVEAFEEYLNHLRPGGLLTLTRWLKIPPRDTLKFFATAIESLRKQGISDPGKRLVLLRSVNTTLLMVKNGVFTSSDMAKIKSFADEKAFDLSYHPGIGREETNRFHLMEAPYLFEGATALLGDTSEGFMSNYKFNIEPATDDEPFFSHFFKWNVFPEILALRKKGGMPLVEWGYLIVWATLIQALMASLLLILLPLWVFRTEKVPHFFKYRTGIYFFALGLAFMFIEIAFIQKFILFLSHPTFSAAVVISSFLVFAGIGSGYAPAFSGPARTSPLSGISLSVIGICSMGLAYLFILPPLFSELMGLNFAIKIVLSVALIAPLGFLMGIPFPLGLSKLANFSPHFIPWAWGINGCASVLSSILATLLSIHLGFTGVILLALLLYFCAALSFRGM